MSNKQHRVKRLEDHVRTNEDLITRMEISFIERDGSCTSRLIKDLIDGEWIEHNEVMIDDEWVVTNEQ